MKKIYSILFLASFLLLLQKGNAQNLPSSYIPYQSVVRNSGGNLVTNQTISLRFSLVDAAANIVRYEETQSATTDAYGLFTVKIGTGTVVSGSLSAVNWSGGAISLKTEADVTGGTNYAVIGTTAFGSVPYAFYAVSSGGNSSSGLTGTGSAKQVTFWNSSSALSGNNNLTWNDSAYFLGIGTNSPKYQLDIEGGSTSYSGYSANSNASGVGFIAKNTAAASADNGYGLEGITSQANGGGVVGANNNRDGIGIIGVGSNIGGYLRADSGAGGVFAGYTGVEGYSQSAYGVGVEGEAPGTGGIGVGTNGNIFAGGNIEAIGNLTASGTKSFMIDHPLDPANKILKHFAIESPEVLNEYRGRVVLDANGVANVQLPDYFSAIDSDFTYTLTPIGTSAPNLYVSKEITGNTFEISGGKPGMKVCWQVEAQRNDPYMRTHPDSRKSEIDKTPEKKGKYLSPESYGQSADKAYYNMGKAKSMMQAPALNKLKTPVEPVNNSSSK